MQEQAIPPPSEDRQPSPTLARLIALGDDLGAGDLKLRWRRCTSWLEQAEREIHNARYDEAFIFCWIAFNAAYSVDTQDTRESHELVSIRKYLALLSGLDSGKSMERAVFDSENRWNQIEQIIGNQFIYADFWKYQQSDPPSNSWHVSLEASREKLRRERRNRDVRGVLEEVFKRLYVMRNQLVHGAATYNGSVNRRQVQWGAALLYLLLPVFLDLMFRNPDADWGAPKYPVLR